MKRDSWLPYVKYCTLEDVASACKKRWSYFITIPVFLSSVVYLSSLVDGHVGGALTQNIYNTIPPEWRIFILIAGLSWINRGRRFPNYLFWEWLLCFTVVGVVCLLWEISLYLGTIAAGLALAGNAVLEDLNELGRTRMPNAENSDADRSS